MRSTLKLCKQTSAITFGVIRAMMLCALLTSAIVTVAQAPAASRFVGSITAISGDTLTVKTDSGEQHQVQIPSEAVLKRIAPGQKDLSTATTIAFIDLAVGDRVLVKLDPNATGATPQAAQIIAVKQEDVAQKQQADREDWQKRGVAGLVKSVDAASGTITLTSGAGATAKTITIHTTKTTALKRYAQASVAYDEAKPAPIDAIHAGDQLRARGAKNADGTEIAAEEVISGTFRNVSGTIASLDTTASTVVVKDLATKKTLTIHIPADVHMRRLPDRMAQMLATRLKGGAAAAGQGAGPGVGGGGQHRAMDSGQGASGQGAGQGSPQGGGDMQQMLSRAPVIHFSDLQKGEAIMVVSTDGASDVTAITLLAGVEPLLTAPAASQNLLSNWSMGSGGAEGASAH